MKPVSRGDSDFVVVQSIGCVQPFVIPAAPQAPCLLLSPGICSDSYPLSWWCYLTIWTWTSINSDEDNYTPWSQTAPWPVALQTFVIGHERETVRELDSAERFSRGGPQSANLETCSEGMLDSCLMATESNILGVDPENLFYKTLQWFWCI